MNALHKVILTGLMIAAVPATAAFAAERTNGKAPTAKAAASASTAPDAAKAKALPPILVDPSASRDLMPTAEQAKARFTLVGRTRDGKEVRKAPTDEMIKAIMGVSEQRGSIEGPAATEKTARAIVGKDSRVRVKNTSDYPYSAIGLMYHVDPDDSTQWFGCTGAVIGKHTVLTSAACLYAHGYKDKDDGKWMDNFTFYPGLNGGKTPLGSFVYDTAYVFDGWIKEYDGTWDSVMPYDIGIVTFSDPIADTTGSLGYWNIDDDADKLDAYLVDYPIEKKPANTMWMSKCKVANKDISENMIVNDCDVGDSDAPLIYYDKKEDQNYIIGMHVATTNDTNRNAALRLNDGIYAWMNSMVDEDPGQQSAGDDQGQGQDDAQAPGQGQDPGNGEDQGDDQQ